MGERSAAQLDSPHLWCNSVDRAVFRGGNTRLAGFGPPRRRHRQRLLRCKPPQLQLRKRTTCWPTLVCVLLRVLICTVRKSNVLIGLPDNFASEIVAAAPTSLRNAHVKFGLLLSSIFTIVRFNTRVIKSVIYTSTNALSLLAFDQKQVRNPPIARI